MASFTKLASGSWRVQVRHKGRYVSESFQRREDARRWATEMEGRIDRGELATSARARGIATFGQLIDLHVAGMKDVGKAPGRSKDATLAMLRRELGAVKMTHIDRERVIQFGRKRAAQSAWCWPTPRPCTACRCRPEAPGLVGKSNQRDHRPTGDGNDQRIPLLAVSGYDALALIEEQQAIRSNEDERIFPYNQKAVSNVFTRACPMLRIENLHFHDLRQEGASRLFEAGFRIEQVSLVTGHKDWNMLRRYTHLKPESLHDFAPRAA